MLKIVHSEAWDSVGNEFIEKLEGKGIKYKLVFKDLKVFKLTNIGISGGKNFDVYEYIRPSNNERTLAISGGFGLGDMAMEEVYLIALEDEQTYTADEVAETIKNYIIKEDEREEKEEEELNKKREQLMLDTYLLLKEYEGAAFNKKEIIKKISNIARNLNIEIERVSDIDKKDISIWFESKEVRLIFSIEFYVEQIHEEIKIIEVSNNYGIE